MNKAQTDGHRVVVEIRGGLVDTVYSDANDAQIMVLIVDHDNIRAGGEKAADWFGLSPMEAMDDETRGSVEAFDKK